MIETVGNASDMDLLQGLANQKAVEKLNNMLLDDKQVYAGPFLRERKRQTTRLS